MNYSFNIATINVNSTNSLVHKSLLKDFLLNQDIDVAFLQEVTYENFSFVPSYTALVNVNADRMGTAILLRKNIEFKHPIFDPSSRILSVVVNGINLVNIYAYSGTKKRSSMKNYF